MAAFEWICIVVLGWLILGLAAIRIAARLGHTWGYHFKNPLLCRLAVILQAPALVLECAAMDLAHRDEDRLAVAAARLMWAQFKEPQADADALLERMEKRRAG